VKISRTGLLCLVVFGSSILVHAQAPQDAAVPADQQPAAPQAPAQQQPAPPQEPVPETTTVQPETRRLKLPPPPPKEGDVRMPGEAGWNIGLTGWLPIGNTFTDKGHAADFTGLSKLQLAGKSKGALGAEIGIAAGLHNSIRISYFNSKLSGTTTAPNDLVIFSQQDGNSFHINQSFFLEKPISGVLSPTDGQLEEFAQRPWCLCPARM